jgi:hypothetical protein
MSDSFNSIVSEIDWEDPRVSLGDEDIDPLGERSLLGQGLLRTSEELQPENQAQTSFVIDPNRDHAKFCDNLGEGYYQ